MANFPPYGGPGEGAQRFGGGGLGTPSTGPIPAPNPFGGGGPRVAAFNTPRPGGNMTLDALMDRQKQAAAQQQEALATPQTTIPGGIGQMLTSFMAGLRQSRAEQEEATGREEITQALTSLPESGIISPEGLATVMRRDPDLGLALYQEAMEARRTAAKADAEQWTPIPTPEGENGQWFRNQQGDTKKVGGGSPGESGWKPSDLGTLRDDYTKAAAVYDNASPTWVSMQESAKTALSPEGPGLTKEGKGAADYNMIVGFAKLLDPNSVVREGEVKSASITGGMLDQLQGWLNQWKGTGMLSDDVRRAIMTEANGRMSAYYTQAKQKRDWIAGIATRNKLNPDDIVPPLPEFQPWGAIKEPKVGPGGKLDFTGMTTEEIEAWTAAQEGR